MAFLTPDDLNLFATIDEAKALEMIADAEALATLAAPCLGDEDVTLTAAQSAAVKAVLRSAILRWNDSGTGALSSETAGPFSATFDTRQPRKGLFWPSEISQLQDICGGVGGSRAFSIDTSPLLIGAGHADICALNFGALYCSCGAVLAGYPLYEVT